jgi:hypothetical protein
MCSKNKSLASLIISPGCQFWCHIRNKVVCVLFLHRFANFCLVVFGFGEAFLCCEVVCRCGVENGVLTRCYGIMGRSDEACELIVGSILIISIGVLLVFLLNCYYCYFEMQYFSIVYGLVFLGGVLSRLHF